MVGRVYSVGYEGMTVDGLIERLVGAMVSTVVDVRLNPISRKSGYSRRRLSERLALAGIEYVHEKDLGNPTDNRESFRSGDGEVGRARMRSLLLNGAGLPWIASSPWHRRPALPCSAWNVSSTAVTEG